MSEIFLNIFYLIKDYEDIMKGFKMTETQFKTNVVMNLRKRYGADIWVYHPVDSCHSGIPDLLICYKGKFIAIELKVGKNEPTKLQKYVLKEINIAGGKSSWFTNYKDAIKDMYKLIEGE